MRILIVSTFLFFLPTLLPAQQSHAFPPFEEAPLSEVLLYLESNFDILFSFRDQNIETEYISMASGNYLIKDYIPLVFKQTRLEFEYIDERHLILKQKSNPENLPGYFCGFVRDQQSGQLLSFANILLKGKDKGVNTLQSGRFELNGVEPGDTLLISYVGYQSLQVIVKATSSLPCPTFYLKLQEMEIEPVVVTVYLMDGILQDYNSQKILIKPAKLSIYPGSVEPDIMTSIQMLPGIFSADETASGLNIRGGTPDQNLVLYDGIPVYHTGHFFGMISAFNPYIVEEVNVYRSGMGSEFGGRVSGVIDIQSDKSVPKKFELGAGLNMIHGHINSRIPVTKNSGLTISMRRSFTDFWSTPTFLSYEKKVFQGTKLDEDQFTSSTPESSDEFFFTDFNLKWQWHAGKNKFGIDLFSGLNNLDYTSEIPEFSAFSNEVVKLENIGSGFYWERDWSPVFATKIKLTNSAYKYNNRIKISSRINPDLVAFDISTTNSLEDGGLNWINTWKPEDNHQVKFGYQFTDNNLGLNFTQIRFNNEPEEEDQSFQHRLHTLFGEYHLSLADILDLDIGVRYQRQTIIKNDYFEPRVALTARINPHFKLKLSSGKQFQFVSQLVLFDLNEILFGNKIWIASNGSIFPVIESNQWTGGILFSKNDWQIDLEGYVKELAGITSFSNSFDAIPEQPYSQGDSRIRGIDVLVKRQFSKQYRSWLSYTLSQAVYEFPLLNDTPFPASHDQRHIFQWVHLYHKNNWELAAGWQFGSGLPFTNAIGTDTQISENQMDTINYIIYDKQNGNRLKPYHRLDASVMYHFGDKEKFSGFAGISLVNIYNHTNILGRQFLVEEVDPENDSPEILQIDQYGLKFTPNLVLRFQW